MAEHEYKCVNGHAFSYSVKVGQSPPKQRKCPVCDAQAAYNWSSKRIGGTVAGGTGGGRKIGQQNLRNNKKTTD